MSDPTTESQIVNLKRFLIQYELHKSDNSVPANFISKDYQYRKRFYVPDAAISQLMTHLHNCYQSNLVLHMFEPIPLQTNIHPYSGLSFDFVFITKDGRVPFEEVVSKFLEIVFSDILTKALRMPKSGSSNHACICLGLPNSDYIESIGRYKQKFTVLIPGIQVSADLKKYISDRMRKSKALQNLFIKKTSIKFHTAFESNKQGVSHPLIGSCSMNGKMTLQLMTIYKVSIEHDSSGSKFDGIISVPNATGYFSNIVYECSLVHQMSPNDGGVIVKHIYEPRSAIVKDMERIASDPAEQLIMEYHKALIDIETMSIYNDIFEQFKCLLDLLSDERIAEKNNLQDIFYALASSNDGQYRSIAMWFFYTRCGRRFTLADFDEMWDNALGKSDVRCNLKSIRYWASLDSPSKLSLLLEKKVRTMLMRDIKSIISRGQIGNVNVANYLGFIFNNRFATAIVGKTIQWYEFVMPGTRDIRKGQLYKWKFVGLYPMNLSDYISTDLEEIAIKVILDLTQEIQNSADQERKKYLSTLKKNFTSSMKNIYSNSFKQQCIAESASRFANDNLVRSLDKAKHIMGVGNGVLEFDGSEAKLLNHYHSYPISLFTETDYIPYDEDNVYIKTVYKMLHSLFPEDEMDAFDFIMYYFSTSLDWFPKESLFLIITGQGCHAIDTPVRMFDGTVKMVQDIMLGDTLMGDDGTIRTVKELFRGSDEMIRVIPYDGEPFEVNIHHILSLKFANVQCISREANGCFMAHWFERNDAFEPKAHIKTFRSENEAHIYLNTLHEIDSSVIRNGDIIDIEINDLLTWSSWWLSTCMMVLYRRNAHQISLTRFVVEKIGNGDYYGFELDGNHRYITGDGFVHHNSNGKSILIEFFRETIGEMYARRMPLSFITEQMRTKSASADPALMEMKHARFVNYSESDRNERANIARIKELTGGDTMSGRQLYGEQENFKPNCNHLLATNHHLRIESTEHAVWRRFLTYRFKMTFKEEPDATNKYERKKDPKFINMLKEDKRYHSAFLAILVHYRSMLYNKYDGQILKVPHPTIKQETHIYRQQEDIYERFIIQRAYYKAEKAPQALDEFMTIFRRYYKEETGDKLKVKSDDLQYLFLNSSIQPFINPNASGALELECVYTVDVGAPIIHGSIMFKEYLKSNGK